jgi:hypothetical protein
MKIKDGNGNRLERVELEMREDEAKRFAEVLAVLFDVQDPPPTLGVILDHEAEDASG